LSRKSDYYWSGEDINHKKCAELFGAEYGKPDLEIKKVIDGIPEIHILADRQKLVACTIVYKPVPLSPEELASLRKNPAIKKMLKKLPPPEKAGFVDG
jgi:hypothetical protein